MKRALIWIPALALLAAGCHTDMWVQPKHKAYQPTTLFPDGNSARPRIPGTVPVGKAKTDDAKYTGFENGKMVASLPAKLEIGDKEVDTKTELLTVIKRGKERFHIYCSHCHGEAGDGKGMITQRGLVLRRAPASYHTDRLRAMPVGHFYDVISNGYGTMYGHAGRIPVDDRWAIVSYIRALQRSQNAQPQDLTAENAQP